MNNDEFVLYVQNSITNKAEKEGFENLNELEKVVELVSWLDYETIQGGLYTYYFNSSGNYANQVISGLETIGAYEAARIIKKTNSLFKGGIPPEDREERLKELKNIEPALEEATDDFYDKGELDELVEKFILENKDVFSKMQYPVEEQQPEKAGPKRCSLSYSEIKHCLKPGMYISEIESILGPEADFYGLVIPASGIVKYTVRLKEQDLRLETDKEGKLLNWETSK